MEKREEGSEFTGLSREEIVSRFDEFMKEKDVLELIPLVDDLESAYDELLAERKEAEKQKFLDEGGSEFDFVYHRDNTDGRFAELHNLFRDRKDKFFEEKKAQERDNLAAKQQVIADLKTLIEKGDSIGKAFQQFRDLRERWKSIGDVPRKSEEDLENSYRHERERFYYIIQLTQGMKELDLQKHLEEKEGMLKRMEELLNEKTIKRAEALIRKYRDDWYDIGPVPVAKKDEIIQRFNDTSEKVYAKIRAHYESLKTKYAEHLQAKVALCEKAEAIAQEEINHHRDWEKKTKEILELQQDWRKIGRVTKEEADAVWERFRKACNIFFDKKRAFYEVLKKDYDENKQAKVKICEQAEAAQNSTDWDKTARFLIQLQRQWEKIGPAHPREDSQLWKRFRTACDVFFDSRKKQFAAQDEERKANLAKREEIVKKLEDLVGSISSTEALPTIKAIAKEWEEAGDVPQEAREAVYKKYTQSLDACYERMGMNESDKEMLKYQNKVERMKGAPDAVRLLEDEKRFLRNRIRSVEDEIAKTENNMGFFAKSSKGVNSLLQDVMKGVEQSKTQLAFLKKKLEIIDKNIPRKEQIR